MLPLPVAQVAGIIVLGCAPILFKHSVRMHYLSCRESIASPLSMSCRGLETIYAMWSCWACQLEPEAAQAAGFSSSKT